MKDKEIELKFVINNEIKNSMLEFLNERATDVGKSHLIDTYYIPNFRDFEINGETIECVRIRENSKGVVLTYKKIHKESNPIYCDEFETEVKDKEQLEKILFALGFSVEMIIDKTRTSFDFGKFRIDFDSVVNLGELLEVELKNSNGKVEEILEFVGRFGLSMKDVTYEGIQALMKKAMSVG